MKNTSFKNVWVKLLITGYTLLKVIYLCFREVLKINGGIQGLTIWFSHQKQRRIILALTDAQGNEKEYTYASMTDPSGLPFDGMHSEPLLMGFSSIDSVRMLGDSTNLAKMLKHSHAQPLYFDTSCFTPFLQKREYTTRRKIF